MRLEAGAQFDTYEVIRPIGSGGMGSVWLATDTRLGRHVAIKFLPTELTRDLPRIARFEQEARAASALNHPNVCTIHALGETVDGVRYIAMEYVEGKTLRDRLATARFSTHEALDIIIQITSALSAAHAAGIVHRDIKPENIMLRPDGLVKVLDFGLAKLALTHDQGATATTHLALKTGAGLVVGTIAYMSPEQARGEDVDARTDIWSLGVLLYEILAGRSPFAAASGTEVIAAILERDPPPLGRFEPTTPAELQRIVTKSLRKDRAQRYQTVQDLLIDLRALREELQEQARSIRSPSVDAGAIRSRAGSGPLLWVRRRRGGVLGTGLLLASLIAASIWAWVHNHSPSPASPSPLGHAERSLSRLTFGPGLQTDATFSPDGRFIAYSSDKGGNFDIWVQPVSGGDPVPITKSSAQDIQPDWSPDGSTIVFRSERDGGGLFIVPALGGPEQRLTSFGMHPKWLKNGSEILFMTSSVSPDESSFPGASLRVYVTSIGREQPSEILSKFVEKGSWYWVAGHPDGRISFLGRSERDRPAAFFTVSRDSGQVVVSDYAAGLPAFLSQGTDQFRRFQWNASGTAIYVEALTGGVRNLWKIDVEPETLRWRSAERLTTSSGDEGAIALSPDGRRLAFTSRVAASRLWAFLLDSTGERLVEPGTPITEEGADIEESDVSRDGRVAAFVLSRPGRETAELWTVGIDTSTLTLIAKNVSGPRWSFDSTRLAYLAPDRLVVRDQTGERTIARASNGLPPPLPTGWTPDGSTVVASWTGSSSIPFAITLWPIATASDRPARTLLADPQASLWQAQFSPNGRWVSFVAEHGGRERGGQILIAPAGGAPRTQWRELATDHEWADKPRWSIDGRTLYFISRRPAPFFNLWGVRFDPDTGTPIGTPFALTHFDSPSQMISPSVDKTEMGIGARRAVLTIRSVTGNVWMLDHVAR